MCHTNINQQVSHHSGREPSVSMQTQEAFSLTHWSVITGDTCGKSTEKTNQKSVSQVENFSDEDSRDGIYLFIWCLLKKSQPIADQRSVSSD